MSEYDECTEPLVDRTVLTGLQAELGGDRAIIGAFVRNYAAMLPWRVARLHTALANLDIDDAMDAVLSLKTSSHMVGAVCMERLATELEIRFRLLPNADHLDELQPQVAAIEQHVSGTIVELETPGS
ncbi:Hpt domain-containing protein [Paenarthrobacter ilicis]|uniref:HPt (Histidine-containing phosphotransfer) domain-containing protein n=1 Tax=Paenarthrobacter ilicis TaxID=43665 RepID=A0ABX0TGX5_9MICC|nr:HPt (histidine-containing phosphotransfer) domain-containing protein [Paenarthrobacter ilicis]NIJ00723.1 HPt (histidine-containing phosphotransfer) domain-containing protein [Paenarthrobacter ilicis]